MKISFTNGTKDEADNGSRGKARDERKGRTKGNVKIRAKGRTCGEAILQLLFPRRCPVCDGIVSPAGEKICLECIGRLSLITPPWCMRCGRKLEEDGEYCGKCRGAAFVCVRGRALYRYSSAAEALYRFKYGGRREYAEYFGEQMAELLGDFIRQVGPDALIPIPLHRARKRKRGYNQAELLAREIGKYTGIPVRTGLLLRVRNTQPLKRLNPAERQNNLKKAFKVAQNDVKLKKLILVDDIYTTGSTMEEAARTLKEAGAEEIYFLALASG